MGTRTKVVTAMAVCVLAALAVPAYAGNIDYFAANFLASPIYDDGSAEWSVPGAPLTDGLAGDTDFNFWDISPSSGPTGLVVWNGHPLVLDTSAGGLASAQFGSGGTFELYGKAWLFGVEQFDGLLIEGTVSGFAVQEQTAGPDFLDLALGSTPILHTTGGYLVNGNPFSSMQPFYELNFSGAEVMQQSNPGGHLEDFQSNIEMVDVVLFNLFPTDIPEPSSVLLLTGLSLLGVRRRR